MIRKQGSDNIIARFIEPTDDAGYIVVNRFEPVLISPGESIYDHRLQ
ncbi:TPA: hypothetical protein ACQKZW_002831 [Staphylococcus aureus]